MLGAVYILCQPLRRGGGGLSQLRIFSDKGGKGEGGQQISDLSDKGWLSLNKHTE